MLTVLSACKSGNFSSRKRLHVAVVQPVSTFDGKASWYGGYFHGRKTANGERYDMYDLTAAHKSLPFNSLLRVTNLENNKSIIVRVNDRGPYIKGRDVDLSYNAARQIDVVSSGVSRVHVEVYKPNTDLAFLHEDLGRQAVARKN